MPENSSQNPPAPSLETRVSVLEVEFKHLATKADLEKMGRELTRELTGEMRRQLYAILAAMGIMMSAQVGGAVAYAHLSSAEAPPPPPPALEAPRP